MRLDLQTKLLGTVTIIVILVAAVLMFVTSTREREIFQSTFRAKGITLAQALEAGIGSRKELKDVEKLQSNIYKLIWLDPEIVKIDISTSTPEGLQVVASNDTGAIGTPPDPENELAFEQDIVRTRTLYQPDTPPILSVITPIHVGGQRLGTYDIKLSLEAEERAIGEQQKQLILLGGAVLLISGLALSLFLKRVVVELVAEIQRGLEEVRAGDLTWRITPRSRDELGDLARGFNKMTEDLEEARSTLEKRVGERTEELERTKREVEEAKGALEIRVGARTKELQELTESLDKQVKERTKELDKRVAELERFQRLTVGREIKMIELKKEIKRLKQELKGYGS